MNAGFARDSRPIDDECDCYTCRTFTLAYLRHLIVAKEMLASTLISIHNVRFLVHLMERSREAILNQQFEAFASSYLHRYLYSKEKK